MNKTTCLMILPLLGALNVSRADGMPDAVPADAAAEQKAPPRERMRAHTPKRLPRGDLRHCLDLTSNEAIIRCAETRRGP